jgi:hypothetical protein
MKYSAVPRTMMRLLLPLIASLLVATPSFADSAKIDFWAAQKKGANMMNGVQTEAQFAAAAAHGIQWIRLAPDKWKSRGKDFLIGGADHYTGLDQADLATLKAALAAAGRQHVKIVLAMLSLPGDRWRQLNGGKDDLRLWQDRKYWDQAAAFWRDLAAALKDEPALVGYNIVNEPHPEKIGGFDEDGARDFAGWYRGVENTPADLNAFNAKVVAAIRSVDADTPIMLDAGLYAAVDAFAYLKPVEDAKTLYAFHMYEPYAFTAPKNKGMYQYPGSVPFAGKDGAWDAGRIDSYLVNVAAWQQAHHVPDNRIVGSEFGCYRQNAGCAQYMGDVIAGIDGRHWHWAFYAFREDGWDGMDYEVGTGKLPWKYWQDQAAGKNPEPPRQDDPKKNPLWAVIAKALKAE